MKGAIQFLQICCSKVMYVTCRRWYSTVYIHIYILVTHWWLFTNFSVSLLVALKVQQIRPDTLKTINNLIFVLVASVSLWISNAHDISLHSVHTSIPAMCLPFVFTSETLPWQIPHVIHILVMLAMSCFILPTQALIWKTLPETRRSSGRNGGSCELSSWLVMDYLVICLVYATFMHMT